MKGLVYQIVIAATPEQVWPALREPEFTQKYWFGKLLKSEWAVGSSVSLLNPEGKSKMTGKVLDFTPNKRLSYTWNTDFPGSAETVVVFELEAFGPMTKLTILHDINMEDQNSQRAVSGWSMIVSGLKTLLETGSPLPPVAWSK